MKTPDAVRRGIHKPQRVTLKTIAEHLSLTPGTVSAALNNSAAARSIPERTKKRILTAAKDHDMVNGIVFRKSTGLTHAISRRLADARPLAGVFI